jgi:hypothetical protein
MLGAAGRGMHSQGCHWEPHSRGTCLRANGYNPGSWLYSVQCVFTLGVSCGSASASLAGSARDSDWGK